MTPMNQYGVPSIVLRHLEERCNAQHRLAIDAGCVADLKILWRLDPRNPDCLDDGGDDDDHGHLTSPCHRLRPLPPPEKVPRPPDYLQSDKTRNL